MFETNPSSGGKRLIAVVVDDPKIRESIKGILTPAGYDVAEAHNGEEFLDIMKLRIPDLVILDIMIPGLNGFQICKLIKNNLKDAAPAVIFLTAPDDIESRERGWRAGCDEFLTKPINPVELLARVKNLLRVSDLSRQLKFRMEAMEKLCSGKRNHPKPDTNKQKFNILIIEDSTFNQLILKSYLEDKTYNITTVKHGKEALELLKTRNFNLIILDLYLPDIDGIDLLKEIRKMESTRFVPVIIITARDDTQTKVNGLESGANDYLVKPVNKLELKARVKALLKFHQLQNCLLGNYIKAAERAVKDGLTGLYNQSYFKTFLQEEITYSLSMGKPLSLLMMDLDDFKNYNDTNGHIMGDKALKETASIILDSIRSSDLAARYGGEEFVVVLPNTSRDEALQVAERIRRRVELHKYENQEKMKRKNLTISIGVAEFVRGMSLTDFLAKADSALYNAKRKGKNAIVYL